VHDVSGGGLLVALAKMALAGDIGVTLMTNALADTGAAFGEGQGRYIVTTPGEVPPATGVPTRRLGSTGGNMVAGMKITTLRAANEGAVPAMMKGEI
jgi:phosphoribosylformylglycinamidine synthase